MKLAHGTTYIATKYPDSLAGLVAPAGAPVDPAAKKHLEVLRMVEEIEKARHRRKVEENAARAAKEDAAEAKLSACRKGKAERKAVAAVADMSDAALSAQRYETGLTPMWATGSTGNVSDRTSGSEQ